MRCLVAFGLTSAFLVFLSCGVYGPSLWLGFFENLEVYVHNAALNVLGFHQAMPWLEMSAPAMRTSASVLTAVLALLLASASRRRGAVAAVALAVPTLFVLVDFAAYYALVLLLWMPAFRHRSRVLALLFAVEALTWGLLEGSGSVSYALSINVYHSLLLLFLFGAVHLETLDREVRRLWRGGGRTKRAIAAAASQHRLEKRS